MLKNVPLSELESMVEILNKNPNAQNAVNVIDQVSNYYEANLRSYLELFDYFNKTKVDTCQFYILQILVKIINNNYTKYTNTDKNNFRSALFYNFDKCISRLTQKQYIVNKFSMLYITWLKYDYPEQWEDAFKVLLNSTYNSDNNHDKLLKLSKYNPITFNYL